MDEKKLIIYNTDDGKTSVSLMTRDGNVWLNQNHLAELFDTSVPNISMHISNILKDNELNCNSVVKDYLTTAADGKNYQVTFYSLDMILAVGFRVRSRRGIQFRQWANRNLEEFVEKVYSQFAEQRKIHELQQADATDLQELKSLEENIKLHNRKNNGK